MKRYTLTVDGFDQPMEVFAETAGKARYRNWKDAAEAGYFTGRDGFKRYLARVYTLHHGEVGDPRTPKYGVAP